MDDIKRIFRPSDLLLAMALLTRLPVSLPLQAGRAPGAAAWAYPLVGLVVAGVALAVGWVITWLGATAPITAVFVLLTSIVVTGAMHEDGLADCADGFWGGWTRERRLEIMKDSTIGTYGVVALVVSLMLRWYVLTTLIDKGALFGAVLVAAVMSRAGMVWVMHRLPHARQGGLSAQTGRPERAPALAAVVLGVVAAVVAPEVSAIWLMFFAVLVVLAAGAIARRKIGGQTGDVLGATQQVLEITVLICFDAMITTWA